MALKIARRSEISPFLVMDVMEAANARRLEGKDVLHLEVWQPSTPAPRKALEAARNGLADDVLGYTDALGLPELRRAIADYYGYHYHVSIAPERVVVTIGASGAFVLAFLAVFDPGDRVGVVTPGYPAYRNILSALGITCVDLWVGAENRYQPEIEQIAESNLQGLVIASPANPTGTMLTKNRLAALAEFCREQKIRLISDEIYHRIAFSEPAATAIAYDPDAVAVNSFSKYFSMTGWRIGWMVVPDDLLRPIERLAQNLFISPPTLAQLAAVMALDSDEELDTNVARYARNRQILLNNLPQAGIDTFAPADGAFYLYADVSGLTKDSQSYCRAMLADTGVASTPGIDFDPRDGNSFVRFSFAGATEEMVEATKRIRDWSR